MLRACHMDDYSYVQITQSIILYNQNIKSNYQTRTVAIMNDEYARLFGEPAHPVQTKSENQNDIMMMLLKSKKKKEEPKEIKKKQQTEHRYVKMAQSTTIKKQQKDNTIYPNPEKKSQNQRKFEDQINRAKNTYAAKKDQNLSQKKIYKPQIVDYFSNDKPKQSQKKQTQKKHIKQVQRQRQRIKYRQQIKKNERSQKSQQKPKQRKKQSPERERSRQKQRKKQIQNRIKQRQKNHQSQRRARQRQREREREKRKNDPHYEKSYKRRHEYEDEDSYEDDGFIEKQKPNKQDWRAEIRQITGYNPHAQKYRHRDRYSIEESNAGRMMAEDRFSARQGRIQQEQDLRREMQLKRKKRQKQIERQRGGK